MEFGSEEDMSENSMTIFPFWTDLLLALDSMEGHLEILAYKAILFIISQKNLSGIFENSLTIHFSDKIEFGFSLFIFCELMVSGYFRARGRPHVILDLAPYNLWRSKDREMKINEKTVIYGSRVILVPYGKEHVEKYHGWMQSEEILQTTASEPLTLENEYKMQESWREDEDKLTFIILLASDVEDGHPEIDSMIGMSLFWVKV